MPSDVVFFHETTRVFHLITQFSYVFCYCLFFERYFLLLFCGGFFLSLFVVSSSPFIAVFHTASVFNQDVSKWNTGAVTTMDAVFYLASAFNSDVSKWNTGAVTTMKDSKCTRSLSLSVTTAPSVVVCC